MRKYLNKLPKEILGLMDTISDIAAGESLPVYLVGGFVRDLILGEENFDLDIVVEGDAIRFAGQLAAMLDGRLIAHKRFGTATLLLRHHQKIDLATARKEFYPQAAHLPVVESGSLKDDLFRRDFTINAMAISLNRDNFGVLVDFFGGRRDIRAKVIRVLHDESFIDDPTRILRAVRFEQRFGFKIEPRTLRLLKLAVRVRMLEKVQPQRLRDDLILMLKEKDPLRQIRRLGQLAALRFVGGEFRVSAKDLRFFTRIRREVSWFKRTYPQRRHLDIWLIYLIGLLDSLSKPRAKDFCRRFALRKGEGKRIVSYKNIGPRFIARLKSAKERPSLIFSCLEPLSYEVIILIKSRYRDRIAQKLIKDFLEIYNGIRIQASGADLKKLGLEPGPKYKKIFTRILKDKLDGHIKSHAEELELIKKLIKEK